MPARFVQATGLPEAPLDAAVDFYARVLPEIRGEWGGAEEIVIGFEPAGHEHRAWRLAAIQDLAREAAPCRVNGVVGNDDDAVAETLTFLESAPGVTGQLLAVDGKSNRNG